MKKDYNMKRSFEDWCQFFRDIEDDPSAIVSGLTVGDLLQARAHMSECDECPMRVDKVLEDAPPEKPFGHIGFN
jgi:hypothetical protein